MWTRPQHLSWPRPPPSPRGPGARETGGALRPGPGSAAAASSRGRDAGLLLQPGFRGWCSQPPSSASPSDPLCGPPSLPGPPPHLSEGPRTSRTPPTAYWEAARVPSPTPLPAPRAARPPAPLLPRPTPLRPPRRPPGLGGNRPSPVAAGGSSALAVGCSFLRSGHPLPGLGPSGQPPGRLAGAASTLSRSRN